MAARDGVYVRISTVLSRGAEGPPIWGRASCFLEVQQFRADVTSNVPDPLYCKKGDNSYRLSSGFLFVCLVICLFVEWRPWPL